MKGLKLFATNTITGQTVPVSTSDLGLVSNGEPMALPGAMGYSLNSHGQIVPVKIQLLQARQ